MQAIEKLIIDILHIFISYNDINEILGDPRTVAILVGGMVAISGALLGTFLVLRQLSLTSDAISHTVLLGIVVAFLVLTEGFNQPPDLTSPWLIIGAALSGVATVWLTELINQSGLVKEDAALGLAFPFLFAIAVLLINGLIENVHLDQDAVYQGEIGLSFAKANEYCFDNCDKVVITKESELADIKKGLCLNCGTEADQPRNCRAAEAECVDQCVNCGTYSPAVAFNRGYIDTKPTVVNFPRSLMSVGLITLINLGFVLGLYKELKLSTFDSQLAAALGFRPRLIYYLLMALVSITAVGAFDSVGAILVVAFFIVPPATAYLLTDRLWLLLILSTIIGVVSVYSGYDLARGNFLGIEGSMDDVLVFLDGTIGLDGYTQWRTNLGASMVMMMGFFFLASWILSPRYGVVMGMVRRQSQQRLFAEQMILIHLFNHRDTEESETECHVDSLPEHLNWSTNRVQRVLSRLRIRQSIRIEDSGLVMLTNRGDERVEKFHNERFKK